jgi:3-oxoadipate enol-lactonase/4-carboxymuconolactone decarboxylase
VAGSDDPSTPPSLLSELAAAISGSRFEVLSPAAHLAPIEQPAAAFDLLLDHLGSGGDADG